MIKKVDEYASEERKEHAIDFAIYMKKEILMLSDLKDKSRWYGIYDAWLKQKEAEEEFKWDGLNQKEGE